MLDKINEINNKLKKILEELTLEKNDLSDSLEEVQRKIDAKIDEAKGYKINVDEYKANITELEAEINSYEKDLEDLKENYGNKGLDTIVEVGTKEINSKIVSKQKEIAKQVEKINELTDRARTIKDLLINLKKDKKEKKDKFDAVSVSLEYYTNEFERIISYSEDNPESLVFTPTESVAVEVEDTPVVEEQPIDDSPVFDEIESMDKEDSDEETKDDVVVTKEDEKDKSKDDKKTDSNYNFEFDNSLFMNNDEEDEHKEEEPIEIKDEPKKEKVLNFNDEDTNLDEKDLIKVEDEEDAHFDDTISSLFATQKDSNIDFKTLNDSIDKEYESIFGKKIDDKKDDVKLDDFNNYSFLNEKDLDEEERSYDHTGFTELDIFGDNRNKPSVTKPLVQNNNINLNTNTDIVTNFFITNKIDFDKFSDENKEYIRKIFNPINFTKVLEVLRKNSIELDGIYQNPKVFEMNSSELDSMITKLLIANQSIHNISLVLSSLPNITLMDLNEVISSFGTNIKDANITDIIIKAKHLSDMGKADR